MAKSPVQEKTEAALTELLRNATGAADLTAEIGLGLPSINIGMATIGDEDDSKQLEMMRITLKTAAADISPAKLRDSATAALSKIPGIKDHVQFESDENHALALRAEMEKFIAKGADIPPNFLDWVGFSDKPQRPEDHGIRVSKDNGLINLDIRVKNVDSKEVEAIASNLKADINDKKNMLAQRIAKYKGIKKDDVTSLDAIKKSVDALDIAITTSQYDAGNGSSNAYIDVKIRTPEQKTLMDDAKRPDWTAVAEAGKSNPLNDLSGEQLGKAIGRSFLFAGAHAKDNFPKLAGRKDMQFAVAKSLVRLKTAKPELAAEVDAFLNDDSFKSHDNWGKAVSEKPKLRSKPFVNKDPSKPEMTIEFALPVGKAAEIIEQLGAQQQASEQQAPAQPSVQMGAVLPPDKQAAILKEALASITPGRQVG